MRQRRIGQSLRSPADHAEQVHTWVRRQLQAVDVRVQIGSKIVVAWHLMPFAALFVQPYTKSAVLHVDVLGLHAGRRTDTTEGINHQANERESLP